jgi:hypothetical protein
MISLRQGSHFHVLRKSKYKADVEYETLLKQRERLSDGKQRKDRFVEGGVLPKEDLLKRYLGIL